MANQEIAKIRREAIESLQQNAAAWRDLPCRLGDGDVYADKDQRLLWLVDGCRLVGMQINPHTALPMVVARSGFTEEQLAKAMLVRQMDALPEGYRFRRVTFSHYCELAAKGSESAIAYIEQLTKEEDEQ